MRKSKANRNIVAAHKTALSLALESGNKQMNGMKQRLEKFQTHRRKTKLHSQYYFDWIRQYRALEVEESSQFKKLHDCFASSAVMGLSEDDFYATALKENLFSYKRDLRTITKFVQILANNKTNGLGERNEFKQAELAQIILNTRESFLHMHIGMKEEIQCIKSKIENIAENEETLLGKKKQSNSNPSVQEQTFLPKRLIEEIDNLEADFQVEIDNPGTGNIDVSTYHDKIDELRDDLIKDYKEVEDGYNETMNHSNRKFNELWPDSKKEESKVRDWDDESRISFRKTFQRFQKGKVFHQREKQGAIRQISKETGQSERECVEYWKWVEDNTRRKERERAALTKKNRTLRKMLSLSLDKVEQMRFSLTESLFDNIHNDIHCAVSTQRQERFQLMRQVRDQKNDIEEEQQSRLQTNQKIKEEKKELRRREEITSKKMLVTKYCNERETVKRANEERQKRQEFEENAKRIQRMSYNGRRYVFKLKSAFILWKHFLIVNLNTI